MNKSYEERKHFLEQLEILSRSEQEEVFRIIRRYADKYSENKNGIFFDVNALRQDTFDRLQEFMNFCIQNRNEQDKRTNEMNCIRSECVSNKDIIPNGQVSH
jgi:hypothetical protein